MVLIYLLLISQFKITIVVSQYSTKNLGKGDENIPSC